MPQNEYIEREWALYFAISVRMSTHATNAFERRTLAIQSGSQAISVLRALTLYHRLAERTWEAVWLISPVKPATKS